MPDHNITPRGGALTINVNACETGSSMNNIKLNLLNINSVASTAWRSLHNG